MTRAAAVVEINHPTGLHARPAVKLTKLAKTFAATIQLRPEGHEPWVDAKSVVKVMAMKLRSGARIDIAADGSDAEPAVHALRGLIERNFDEDG